MTTLPPLRPADKWDRLEGVGQQQGPAAAGMGKRVLSGKRCVVTRAAVISAYSLKLPNWEGCDAQLPLPDCAAGRACCGGRPVTRPAHARTSRTIVRPNIWTARRYSGSLPRSRVVAVSSKGTTVRARPAAPRTLASVTAASRRSVSAGSTSTAPDDANLNHVLSL